MLKAKFKLVLEGSNHSVYIFVSPEAHSEAPTH